MQRKQKRQPENPLLGRRATSQSVAFVYDLSTLSGSVHQAPGNPAQRNMVPAMTIHQHTHNHMPPLSFQWARTTFTFASFQQTLSIQTPCGGARVKRESHYKVAADAHTGKRGHTHTPFPLLLLPLLCWTPVGWTEEMWISVINAEVNIAQRWCWPLVVFLVWCLS